ncbi:MAG TPA: hypothetical protein DCS29_03905 [Candidatus Magasanikbacteria bacterium]|nr:MAG: hypothetical protein A2479_03745 [Candidatus Magasanikbacteria bacterium RIFOXYC2_FULL_39_8]HAT03888.1 hypothetical protein [Candidatus Magasanikbacteria bacterium]
MIHGIVIHGDGLGRSYGYPTANLDCIRKDVKFSSGVYAAWAFVNHKKYTSALVIQHDPWKVEVYIIGFDGDLYGKYVEVDPVQKVSELEWFETTEEIIKKIDQDIVLVKEVLALK